MIQGQINRGSKLGEIIYNLAKQDDVKTILDSGTFNGMGTTKCILDAIKDSHKSDFTVYSFECNFNRYLEAVNNLSPLFKGFNLIYGTIVSAEEIEKHKNVDIIMNSNMKNWLNEDIEHMSKCKSYKEKVQTMFWDLAILDGSEFTGDEEFNLIKNNFKYLILDDAMAYKHCRNREFILNNLDKYNIIVDEIKERNGYIVVNKK